MGILSIFNLKKDFTYLKNSGKFDELKKYIEAQVITYVQKELSGEDKKAAVVTLVLGFLSKSITPVNPIIGSILGTLAPILVQYVYDSLKKYVNGLTVDG